MRMKSVVMFICCIFAGILQTEAQLPNDWENPLVLGINKLPARNTSMSYPNEAMDVKGERTNSTRYRSLNENLDLRL